MPLTQKTTKIFAKDNNGSLFEVKLDSKKDVGILDTTPTTLNTAELDNNSLIFVETNNSGTTGYPVYTTGQQTIDGTKKFTNAMFGTVTTLTGSEINTTLSSVYTKTISSNTTFTITNTPANTACFFTLVLINGGNYTVTFPNSVKWTDNTIPEFTTNGTDIITFFTYNGGTTWFATLSMSGITS